MIISKNKMVQIHYTMTTTDGSAFDTSRNGEPLEYLHGNGNLISGLEEYLEGKNTGDTFSVTIPPENAYGIYDERLVAEVPRTQFDEGLDIKKGMKFQADTLGGTAIVTVTKVSDDTITVDANHELAGKTLNFDVEVISVRDATDEELLPQFFGCGSSCGGGCGGCGSSCGSGCQSSDDAECDCGSCGGCH